VVEILVEELREAWVSHSGIATKKEALTSFAGLAMSLKGTGTPDMMTVGCEEKMDGERNREGSSGESTGCEMKRLNRDGT